MSGRRHHYIPQFLQRGFASHFTSKDFYTWVYRKDDINPFNSNIKNIGMEGDFYSEDKDTSLDKAITESESEFGLFIDELRKADYSSKVNQAISAKLIAHLEARTKNIRINFRNAGTHVVNEMAKYLQDSANCEQFVRKQVLVEAKGMIDKELLKRNVPRHYLPKARAALAPLIEQQIPEMTLNMSLMMKHLLENLPTLFNNSAKSGHVKALTKSHTPPIKVSIYEKLNFQIIDTGGIKIPLGDSGVIFNTECDREFKPYFEKGNKLLAAILPISTDRILVGSIKGHSIDINKIPSAVASCSLQYFISSDNNNENEGLRKMISKNTEMLTPSEMDEILLNLMVKN